MPRNKLVVKSILHNRIDYQCEIDLTDKELNSDNDFKLIMVYEDTHTKFVINRPLRCKRDQHFFFIFNVIRSLTM